MAVFDIIILTLVAWGLYKGFRKGFFYIVLSFAGLIIGFMLATRFSSHLIPFLQAYLDWPPSSLLWVAYVLIFLMVIIMARLISLLLEKFFKWTGLGWLNRIAGGMVSSLKYLLIAGLLFTAVDEVQSNFKLFPGELFEKSTVYRPLVENTRKFIDLIGDLRKKDSDHLKENDLESNEN